MYHLLEEAEKQFSGMLKDVGRWKASVIEEKGVGNDLAETLCLWREFQTNHHVVLKLMRGNHKKDMKKSGSQFILRVVRGIASIGTAIETTGMGEVPIYDTICSGEYAAGSVYRSADPYGMHSICPIYTRLNNHLMLTTVIPIKDGADYTKGLPMKEKHLEWMLHQFLSIYEKL